MVMLAEPVATLGRDLAATRKRTERIAAAFRRERLLGPRLAIVNPPLWELGHLGWFQERWCLRHQGEKPLKESVLPGADGLYDSSAIPHDIRWDLPLPALEATQRYLANVLELVLDRLEREPENESLRYFVRLATYHEDMHGEAFHYTCQTLGYADPCEEGTAQEELHDGNDGEDLHFKRQTFLLGAVAGKDEFVFDNEKWAHEVEVGPFAIDSQPVSNAQYLRYVEQGGRPPRYWMNVDGAWSERRFDGNRPLRGAEPVRHVDWNEAQAYCRWAKRRLPSEAEFELALSHPSFSWGALWEWTASAFQPYPGFVIDPYADYSKPWFGTHKVLRGASFTTPDRMKRSTFRNFYTAERGDVFCGFRTCALVESLS
jgi:gamma-glutamyl hercynylcysteine S-oxide synthase